MALTLLLAALALHVAATCMSLRLARSSRRLSWSALALATVLLALWRFSAARDTLAYDIPIDFGTEILASVIALLIIIGMRTATLAHAALRRSESRHRTVLESAMDAIVVLDARCQIVYTNPAVEWMFGYRARELLGKPFTLLAPNPEAAFDRATPNGGRRDMRERVTHVQGRHADGRVLELELTFGEHEEDGRLLRTGILRDVTARQALQEQLKRSEERYLLAARGANDGLWDWNLKSGEVFFSQRWHAMLGLQEADACATPSGWFGRIHPQDCNRVRDQLLSHLDNRTDHFECEYRALHANGTYRWMLCRGLAVRDNKGTAERIVGSQTDITSRKDAEERLLHEALHDSLTGLPNRALLLERLGRCLARTRRRRAAPCAVLFVDLDRFKNINDSLGHALGDKLLEAVARKLEACVRPTDTVARFGGDEFAILLEDLGSSAAASEIAERILEALSESIRLNTHEIVTTASIGIVWGTNDYEAAEDLLRDADAAMYRAKELGKARYAVFDTSLREHVRARLKCEADLRRAIERKEIELAYQPIISLESGRIAGFEALARWQRKGEAVPPSDFIPLAEETGLITDIEQLLILRACQELAEWQRKFPLEPPLTMSVNLSGRHLREAGLVDYLRWVLRETEPAPGSVRLEITESLLLANDSSTNELLQQIRELGFELVIDDFGTGYSSLSYLHRLPVDVVKLDRSFVHGLESAEQRAAIVNTVVALAKQLSLTVVAEGVETIAELDQLRRFGCDMAQGFLFSRPVDGDSAAALVAREIEVFDCSKASKPRKRSRVKRPRLVA